VTSTKTRPRPWGEIWHEFADSLQGKDARYQRFWEYKPVPVLLRPGGFFSSPKKTKVIFGGNRSTKSTACAFETVSIYTGMLPPSIRDIYPHKLPTNRPRRCRIIVMDYTKHWPLVIKPMLLGDPERGEEGILPEAWSMWNEAEHIFYGPDGSMLSIDAVNPDEHIDPRKLRGAHLDHTWIDEINREEAYKESLTRGAALPDGPRTVTLSYCPQEGYQCHTYVNFYLPTHDPQTKQPLPEEKQHPEIFCQKVSMRDNPSISAEQRAALVATFKPWEIAYRVDGDYSQRAANPYFNMATLIRWEEESRCSDGLLREMVVDEVDSRKGIYKGHWKKVDRDKVDLKYDAVWEIWETPKHDHRYILPADCAEGNPDSDKNAASVWDVTTPGRERQVVHFNHRLIKPGEFAEQCACVGDMYQCLVAPEVNNTAGGIFVDRIRTYNRLYTRVNYDKKLEKEIKKLGWYTDAKTKGLLLDELYKVLALWTTDIDKTTGLDYCGIRARSTLLELMAYEERVVERKDPTLPTKIVWGARSGANDDCVSEMMIGMRVSRHQRHKLFPCKIEKSVVEGIQNLREFEKRKPSHVAFSNLKKKPSTDELRRKARPDGWRTSTTNTRVRARTSRRPSRSTARHSR
jgi:hypothetical protein